MSSSDKTISSPTMKRAVSSSSPTHSRETLSVGRCPSPAHLAKGPFGLMSASGLHEAKFASKCESAEAEYKGEWELPVVGRIPAPTAVVIRPDGHVVWVGQLDALDLHDALTTWFGRSARRVT